MFQIWPRNRSPSRIRGSYGCGDITRSAASCARHSSSSNSADMSARFWSLTAPRAGLRSPTSLIELQWLQTAVEEQLCSATRVKQAATSASSSRASLELHFVDVTVGHLRAQVMPREGRDELAFHPACTRGDTRGCPHCRRHRSRDDKNRQSWK